MAQSDIMAVIGRYRDAEAGSADYDAQVFCVAHAAFKVAVDRIPHHQTVATFVNMNEKRRSLSTRSEGTVATARRVLQDVKDGHVFGREIEAENADYLAAIRELVIAAEKRTIEIAALRSEHRVDETTARSHGLGSRAGAAMDAALFTPVQNLGELLLKAELAQETDNWERVGEDMLADIRRLAGKGC